MGKVPSVHQILKLYEESFLYELIIQSKGTVDELTTLELDFLVMTLDISKGRKPCSPCVHSMCSCMCDRAFAFFTFMPQCSTILSDMTA